MMFSAVSQAQSDATAEELEQQLEEQRIALEQAISAREATKALADDVKQDLADSEAHQKELEEELQALCKEQQSLTEGTSEKESLEDCMDG